MQFAYTDAQLATSENTGEPLVARLDHLWPCTTLWHSWSGGPFTTTKISSDGLHGRPVAAGDNLLSDTSRNNS